MGKHLLLVWMILVAGVAHGQSHGLRFSSHEVVPEKRTAVNLTADGTLCFRHKATISFDLIFTPHLETYFGYLVRLVSNSHQNIDIVYNQKLLRFQAVIGETASGEFSIDSAQLYSQWNRLTIELDPAGHEVSFYLNGELKGKGRANIDARTCYQVFFGVNDLAGFRITDIPPMSIRDIRIEENGKGLAYYPLSETGGLLATDSVKQKQARVSNPVWIKPRHQNWAAVAAVTTRGVASVAFDRSNDLLYIIGKDSLYQYSCRNAQLTGIRLAVARDTLPPGNQSVYDVNSHQLYNIDIDEKEISTWQPALNRWSDQFTTGPLTTYWQANKFLSSVDSSLYVIGGYGQLQYRNEVQRYHFPSKEWEPVDTKGDFFMPRYLAALGASQVGDTAWIIGGFGSKTGDQTINPKYTYDLMAYDVRNHHFKSIYHLPEPAAPFCFANSLVIDPATRDLYALVHPIDRFNSSLQLIKGSLDQPRYELMGDSIPYPFHDIESFADLYYSAASQQLVAVTIFTNKQNESRVRVYALDFPPNRIELAGPPPARPSNDWIWFLLAGVIIAGGVLVLMRRKKQGRLPVAEEPQPAVPTAASVVPPVVAIPTGEPVSMEAAARRDVATVHLFGPLEVFDKEGNDITKLFTPLLRELFLLMLTYTIKDGKGITSEKLYETLWGDKPVKDARNNFSVNVVKLKGILEKVGEWHIGKESGRWKLEVLHQSVVIDYQRYVDLAALPGPITRAYVQELLPLAGRGAFLGAIHYSWLDDIKSEVSGRIIDILQDYLSKADLEGDTELVIRVANCIFLYDQLNEDALAWKCRGLMLLGRHGMARDAWVKFAKEYRENYGQDFDRSFTEITG